MNKLAKQIHEANVKNGFYDKPVEFGTRLMLVVSELSEAIEADRKTGFWLLPEYQADLIANATDDDSFKENFKEFAKDTVQDEIADAVIRLLDLCAFMNIDIDFHVKQKLRYNSLREHKHGKSY